MDNLIGENIRKLRLEKGLTQKDLAEKSGTSLSALNKYERGDRTPKIDSLEKIAEALNVQVNYLLGNSEFKRFDSQIMKDDILSLIEKTDNTDKEFSKLVRNIVDTMFLTVYHFAADEDVESLTIIHNLYRKIWSIKLLTENKLASDLLYDHSNNIKQDFDIYKEEINMLVDELYKNTINKNK